MSRRESRGSRGSRGGGGGGDEEESAARLREELVDAYDRIAELEQGSGLDQMRARAEATEARLLRAEEDNARLQRENERHRDALDANQDRSSGVEKALRDERAAREAAVEALQAVKLKFERAEDSLTRERQRVADAAAAGARAVKDRQSNSAELDKFAGENAELRDEIRVLNEDILAYREAVAELKGELEDAGEDRAELEQQLREQQRRGADLAHELEEARAEAARAQQLVDGHAAELRAAAQRAAEAQSRMQADTRRAEERAAAAERQAAQLFAELRTVKSQTRVPELEEAATQLRAQLAAVTAQRDEASTLLDEHNQQLETMGRELRELEAGREAAIAEAVRGERRRVEAGAREIEGAGAALREERSRFDEVLQQKAEVERELEEARVRLQAYEAGYGLEDAVREQERLREAVRRRDADIARLTRTAGAQLDAFDVAVEIARRLAERAGLAPSTDIFRLYPELELRSGIDSAIERLRALNSELQSQNDALEEQRTRLLRQLRVHAEQTGGASLKYYGLAAEQLMLVNEFAENLRDGKVELPVNDRTIELQGEVRRLRAALEDAKERQLLALASAATAPVQHAVAQAPVPAPAPAPAPIYVTMAPDPQAEASARALQQQQLAMRETIQQAADENRRLREQVEGMLGAQTRSFQALKAGKLWGGTSAAVLASAEARKAHEQAQAATTAALTAEQRAAQTLIERDEARLAAESTAAQAEQLATQLASARTELEEARRAHSASRDETQAQAALSAAAALAAAVAARTPARPTAAHAADAAGFGPRSPAGRALLGGPGGIRRSGPEGAPMPAAEWAAEVTDVRAALVEALEELAVHEDESRRGEALVRESVSRLGDMVAQQTALYREYVAERASWEQQMRAAAAREQAAAQRAEAAAVKARRFDELCASLEGAEGEGGADAAEALTFVAGLGVSAAAGASGSAGDGAKLRGFVKTLARKLAALEVAQPMLARRHNLLKQEASAARAGQRSAELASVEAEAHLRQRILYLELWKRGAEARLARLTVVEEQWVPGDEHRAMVAQLSHVQARYADLLASEGLLRVHYGELRGLPAVLAAERAAAALCAAELEQSGGLLAAAREEAARARALLLPQAQAPPSTPGPGGAGTMGAGSGAAGTLAADPAALASAVALLQTASRAELVACVSRQRALLAEAEVASAAAEKRASIGAARNADLEAALAALQERAHRAEDGAAEVRASATAAHAARSAAEAKLAAALGASAGADADAGGGLLTEASARELRERQRRQQEELLALRAELHKAREVADLASDQAAAVTGLAKDREAELEGLRETLRALASRSDDDAIIGSLQHQLLALKGSFHAALRKHDGLRHSLQRTRVAATALEVVIDQRAGEVLAVREDARVKQLALTRLVDELRAQVRAADGGGVSLQQAQAFNDAVRRLSASADRQAAELEQALHARHAAEAEAEAKALTVTALTRAVDDLRAAGAAGASTSGESRDVFRRLVELHDQLRGAQLAALRHRRELAVLRDEARLRGKRMDDYEANVRGLEERLVAQLTEGRRREDEHRRQVRAAVVQARAEAGDARAIAAGTRGGLGGDDSAAASGAGATSAEAAAAAAPQLEAEVARLRGSLREAERRMRELRERSDGAVERARTRKRRVAFLEKQLEIHGVAAAGLRSGNDDDDAAADDEDEGFAEGGAGAGGAAGAAAAVAKIREENASGMAQMKEHYEAEARRLQKAAQATTASLKELLDKKNAAIRDYQEKLEAVRRERDAERAREVAERERISQTAYEENKVTIDRLRAAVRDLQTAPANSSSALVNQQLVDRCEALERALAQRDRRLGELQAQAAHLAQGMAGADSRISAAQQAAQDAAASAASTAAASTLLLLQPQELQTQLEAARRRADEAERQLRDGLGMRDRKLRTLQASFAALKEQFVRAEEEHAVALAQLQAQTAVGPRGAAAAAAAVAAAAAEAAAAPEQQAALEAGMRDKVAGLAEQVQRFAKEVRALKAKEAEDAEERGALTSELEAARERLQQQRDEARAAEAAVGRARAEIARMQAALQHQQAEHQHALAEAMAHGSKATADALGGGAGGAGGGGADALALQRRVRVLEAQNVALRSAQAESGGHSLRGAGPEGLDASQLQTMITAAAAAQAKAVQMQQQGEGGGGEGGGEVAQSSAAAGGADVRVAWEEQRKLRKRLEALQLKLNERTREAETARSAEGATLAALAKVKSERDTLEKRLGLLVKKQQSLDAATVAALNEIEPVAQLKARVFSLEEDCAALREQAEGELAGEARRLRAEAEAARLTTQAAQAEAAEARERLRQLQRVLGGDGPEGGTASVVSLKSTALRAEEDRYLAEATLRDRLAEARRQVAGLEGALLARDAAAMELRFELEAARQAAERLRKRVSEVSAFATIATRGRPLSEAAGAAAGSLLHNAPAGAARTGAAGAGGGGGGAVRQAELEEVMVALRRVTEKQKGEIERLRKQLAASGQAKDAAAAAASVFAQAAASSAAASAAAAASASAAPPQAPSAELAEAARSLKAARAEVKTLRDRVVALETPLPLPQPGPASGAGGKSHAAAEGEARRAVVAAEAEARRATNEAQALRARCEALEKSLREAGNAKAIPPPTEAAPAAPAAAVATAAPAVLVESLRASSASNGAASAPASGHMSIKALSSVSALAVRAKNRVGAAASAASAAAAATVQPSAGGGGGERPAPLSTLTSPAALAALQAPQLRERVAQLERENGELRGELSAFDLDFFEEIEDLKYKYAEAAKKCRAFDAYVERFPPPHR